MGRGSSLGVKRGQTPIKVTTPNIKLACGDDWRRSEIMKYTVQYHSAWPSNYNLYEKRASRSFATNTRLDVYET